MTESNPEAGHVRRDHRLRPDDDLLSGLDRAGRTRGMQAFFATTLVASLLVWDLAFTLGARTALDADPAGGAARVAAGASDRLRTAHRAEYADIALGIMILLAMPFTLWALARILAPDYFAIQTRRLKALSAGILIAVGLAGFLVGQFNYVFTTCQDYVVAGDDQPRDCHQGGQNRP